MANKFNSIGIKARAVWGDTPSSERAAALSQLRDGEVQVVFSVDLFNEGVDVPSVDTLLLLRPTESATLFLQQLGRGLRKSKNKSVCTVLDFVGMHRREFRFDLRLAGLLGGTRKYLKEQVEQSFPYLPAGCHMELDHVAREVILTSLKSSLPSKWPDKVGELNRMIRAGIAPTMKNYILESGLSLSDIYAGSKSWSDYLDAVGIETPQKGRHETVLRRSVGRLLHIDDEKRLDFYIESLRATDIPNLKAMTVQERRMIRMLVAASCHQVLGKDDSLEQGLALLWAHPQVVSELRELFVLRRQQIDHIHMDLSSHQESPLQIHARYSRIEILAAFGVGKKARTKPWREGALWIEKDKVDVLAFTLDKSEGQFSPTTMYRDYAINRELIHWESQSTIRSSSPTGERYCNHVEKGTKIMLFARENTDERSFWFLGPATYVSHVSERPMEITWKLEEPLPGDIFTAFAAAVA